MNKWISNKDEKALFFSRKYQFLKTEDALSYYVIIIRTCVYNSLVDEGAGFPILKSCVQNHWVAPRSTQPFILPRSVKWVPGISRNLLVKSKPPP